MITLKKEVCVWELVKPGLLNVRLPKLPLRLGSPFKDNEAQQVHGKHQLPAKPSAAHCHLCGLNHASQELAKVCMAIVI